MIIKLTADQSASLPFPIGCPVWYNFSGENMKRGIIKSASLQDSQIYYEVTYSDDDGGDNESNTITEEVKGTNVGFGATCPVTISPDNNESGSSPLEGEIVMCTTDSNNKLVYTAMIYNMDTSHFRYESDIEASRVTYREVKVNENDRNEENNEANAIENSNSAKHTSDSKGDEADKKDTTHSQESPNQRFVPSSITCSDSASKRSSAGSNEGVRDSARKRARYPNVTNHEGGDGRHYSSPATTSTSRDATNVTPHSHSKFPNVPKLEITPPLWLQKDRPSQRRLFFHLLGSSRQNMTRITQESQCRIHIDMKDDVFVPMKIYVDANNVSTAQQDLLRARQMIQDLFMNYVGNDGCRGRLLYEIAQSCWGPHRPTHSLSNAVKDLNPLLDYPKSSFMSIVEISYEHFEHLKEKSFHAAHILHKPFLREISNLGCDLILVAKGFQVYTNLCDPYVFVYGRTYQDVDRAVRMVKEKIRDHQHVCGKCVLG